MTNAKHVMPFRRKREGRTNYKKRLALLKSGQERIVIRLSNRHIILQLVRYHADGDKILFALDSKTLQKHGWKHGTKSLPAAFLTGALFGKMAVEKGVKSAIVDLGLQHHRAGSRVSSAQMGVVAGGLNVPIGENIFPSGDRVRGQHISEAVAKDTEALAAQLGFTLPDVTKKEAKKEKKEEKKAQPKEGKKPEQKKEAPAPKAAPAEAEAESPETEDPTEES